MKIVFVAVLFLLSGCGKIEKGIAIATGYSKICVDNVTYLQFTSGASVQVDHTGRPVTCN